MKFGYLMVLFVACDLACAPEPRPETAGPADAAAPGDGSVVGGSGGAKSGGAGGKAAGGAGGTGGTAGASAGGTGGATGGTPGTGGMPATGGAAGAMMMTGGMAGMQMPPPPPGPVAKPTAPVLFAGTSTSLSKVVGGDAGPGYFYVVQPGGNAATISAVALAGADLTGLPAGVTFAQKTTNTTLADSKLYIVGFNFRADDGTKWRWIDSTDYPGFTFWAKASAGPLDVNTTTVDGTNILASDPRIGSCTAEPCVAVHGKSVAVTSTWTQFKFKWSDFIVSPDAVQGPVDFKQMGRIDLLFVIPSNSTLDVLLTGVQLATAAQLN